ncbi:DUF3883 domain-containing protein [Micromonospora sp. NPDC005313]|uniref:DUF3883 domain-containing protein n=1 Tax=Micromonospora sp. NPDC005313 TaxID=3154296 RepID=UPI0033A6FF93
MIEQGWKLEGLPANGKLAQNRQALILQSPYAERRLVLHVYKITGSSRGRLSERRIEITTTYGSGRISRNPGYDDVVLGYDPIREVFVGFDPRRLTHGGQTHNASSFFHFAALEATTDGGVRIYPRSSELLGIEYHAFFTRRRAAEYLQNAPAIHAGAYVGFASKLAPTSRKAGAILTIKGKHASGQDVILRAPAIEGIPAALSDDQLVREIEEAGTHETRRIVSPEQLEASRRRAAENGLLGERVVYDREIARLTRAGLRNLADRVVWVSIVNAAAGYDIESFETDGTKRYIEVKSTQGHGNAFPMSLGEWRMAEQFRSRYVIARVCDVRGTNPLLNWHRDPVQLEADGLLTREMDAIRVVLNQ